MGKFHPVRMHRYRRRNRQPGDSGNGPAARAVVAVHVPRAPHTQRNNVMQPYRQRRGRHAHLLALLLVLLPAAGAVASPHDHDHDRARAALGRGEVRPLAEILETVTTAVPGDIVEVELERERGTWVYELKVIAPDGRRLEVMVDAATGALLQHEEDY